MPIESWLPIGFALPRNGKSKLALYEGRGWQILSTQSGGGVLIAKADVAADWLVHGLLDEDQFEGFSFGGEQYRCLLCEAGSILRPLSACHSPNSFGEANAFAVALRESRELDQESSFADAIYVPSLSRLLPVLEAEIVGDDVVLGSWLTGGLRRSVLPLRPFSAAMSWLPIEKLTEVVSAAGIAIEAPGPSGSLDGRVAFSLPGRPALETFFREHVIDIVENAERYAALGIGFPTPIILHGPPGCGKTFAVEALANYLNWPCFQIDAGSVASPYIHDTSRKVAQVFERAADSAPSLIIMDEMDAFLSSRNSGGSGNHHVEEVAEFLRRIPEAAANKVLLIAMTNRLDAVDDAIKRRGRFDHVISVGPASAIEIETLLSSLLAKLPTDDGIDVQALSARLEGRPLSDLSFIVREGGRLAARDGATRITQAHLETALWKARGETRSASRAERSRQGVAE